MCVCTCKLLGVPSCSSGKCLNLTWLWKWLWWVLGITFERIYPRWSYDKVFKQRKLFLRHRRASYLWQGRNRVTWGFKVFISFGFKEMPLLRIPFFPINGSHSFPSMPFHTTNLLRLNSILCCNSSTYTIKFLLDFKWYQFSDHKKWENLLEL